MKLTINNVEYQLDIEPDTPLLWAIRDSAGLTGTKFGCGIAQCGACTLHLDGKPVRSCAIPASAAIGKKITTIEGLAKEGQRHPLQQAWEAIDVPQCGYCQSGQLMAAAALLENNPRPNDVEIDSAMTNLCRCGSYLRIKQAIKAASKAMEVGHE